MKPVEQYCFESFIVGNSNRLAYEAAKAFAEGKGVQGNVFTNTLYCDYGKRIYFTKDSETNMKVTTPEDIRLMETFLKVMELNGEVTS